MSHLAKMLRQLCMTIGAIILITGLAITLANSLPYLFGGSAYREFFGDRDPSGSRSIVLLLHVAPGIVALLVGPWQLAKLGARVHRSIGLIYCFCVLLSSAGSLVVAPYAIGGPVASLGFGVLGFAWLSATLLGLLAIAFSRVSDHREWMLRSYALTCSAVVFRLELAALNGLLGIEFERAYAFSAWASWLPMLVLAEAWIRSHGTGRK
ncbi:DUF2306 domain-containing protein [Altererythrobacter sp. MF3-039]|uniref:DUF2306 domain-containing protein n=1 Tax=Altererythrobacter sp. MF3-039 TaxID=3252901 RepID=UPI00390CC870